jgi:hypothetical protein
MKFLLAAVPVVFAGSILVAPAAVADDRTCTGTIRAVSTDKNVIVPSGKTCRLMRTRIDGNVVVEGGATLIARGVRVDGNIQAEDHRRVEVLPRWVDGKMHKSRINGSIQLKQGGGGELRRNIVGSDIQLFSNDGLFTVRRNHVEGNLQCKSNTPKPVGGGNQVQGNKEDQCRNL